MASYEELADIERRLRETLARGAEAQLRDIPGVVGVSVGLKQRAGAVTDEHVIRVYVREKLPLDRLPRAQRIPAEIDGVPTDVNVLPAVRFQDDETRYRPILGGIEVTNRIIVASTEHPGHTEQESGALGCIATFNSDKSAVLLSNWHVLAAHNAGLGDRIYQPSPDLPPVLASDDANDAIGRLRRRQINESLLMQQGQDLLAVRRGQRLPGRCAYSRGRGPRRRAARPPVERRACQPQGVAQGGDAEVQVALTRCCWRS